MKQRVFGIGLVVLWLGTAVYMFTGGYRGAREGEFGDLAPFWQIGVIVAYRFSFVYWAVAYVYCRQMIWTAGKSLIANSFLTLAVLDGVKSFFVLVPYDSKFYETFSPAYHALSPYVFLGAIVALITGLKRSSTSESAMPVESTSPLQHRYYISDELVSSAARVPTANEDLDRLKDAWTAALQPLVKADEKRTALQGTDRFSRLLMLERYVPMPSFEGGDCGQLRTVHIRFNGPGDSGTWMSVEVSCFVDLAPVGQFSLENVDVLAARENPTKLIQFRRIPNFLETGKIPKWDDLPIWIQKAALGFVSAVLAIPVTLAAMLYAPIRRLQAGGKPQSRFVPTQQPEILPTEQGGEPIAYWNALLPELAVHLPTIKQEVLARLSEREKTGIRTYEKDVVQWGGFRLKEVRKQIVVELNRAKVFVSVFAYGQDLYVRWDSHLNRQRWILQKFPFVMGVGYRFSQHFLSWATPLFTDAPEIYEYAPGNSRITDYDWADVDAIQDLIHETITNLVRGLKEKYKVEKEIDFEMKQGLRPSAAESEEGQAPAQAPRSLWGGFKRRQ